MPDAIPPDEPIRPEPQPAGEQPPGPGRGEHTESRMQPPGREQQTSSEFIEEQVALLHQELIEVGFNQDPAEILEIQGKIEAGNPPTADEQAKLIAFGTSLQANPEALEVMNRFDQRRRAYMQQEDNSSSNSPGENTPSDTEETDAERTVREENERQINQRKQAQLGREAQEAFDASEADPLDVDKRKKAAEKMQEAQDHHDKHGAHGAEGLLKGAPWWTHALKGAAIAFYIYMAFQWTAAAAVENSFKGSK